MFAWHHAGSFHSGPPTVLKYGLQECARLHERVGGTWFCTLRTHLPHERHVHRECRTYETGKAGCEEWARRHEAEIAEVFRKSTEESRARQTYLGNGPVRLTLPAGQSPAKT